jgi:hypothetical protein
MKTYQARLSGGFQTTRVLSNTASIDASISRPGLIVESLQCLDKGNPQSREAHRMGRHERGQRECKCR